MTWRGYSICVCFFYLNQFCDDDDDDGYGNINFLGIAPYQVDTACILKLNGRWIAAHKILCSNKNTYIHTNTHM